MNRPIGVLLISVLAFIRGFFGLFGGFVTLGMGGLSFISGYSSTGAWTIIFAIVAMVVGLITVILAYGLMNMKGWAVMWLVIILGIGLIADLFSLTQGHSPWISIILSVIIIGYLLTPSVRDNMT